MIHDISIPMSAATREWPGDQPFECGWTCRIDRGDSINLAAITTSFHVGTHADAPLHVHDGWPASEALTVSAFIGPVRVITAPQESLPHSLSVEALRRLLGPTIPARVLLRTGRTIADGAFPDDWPVLTSEAADWLVDEGLVLWGVDAPSVDHRHSKTLDVHHALLGRGAFVLENLDLRYVAAGDYELVAPPLLVTGADAAPVRAVLRSLHQH
ncbi:MAG: cyclase family protein [Gemmatimonadaceae bacterium]|nr:cyclase family protein [Gemmatimonadaceae bacterium]